MIKTITVEQYLKLENFELKKSNLDLNVQSLQNQILKLQAEYESLCKRTDEFIDDLNAELGIDLRAYRLREGVVVGENNKPVNFPDVVNKESRRQGTVQPAARPIRTE